MKRTGRPPHKKTPESSKLVCVLAQYGVSQEAIASEMGITRVTLVKHYANELSTGRAKAEIAIRKTLFEKAVKDKDLTAGIFLGKCMFGMRETSRVEMAGGMRLRWEDE